MKTSSKLLWGGFGFLIVLILIFLIDSRLLLNKIISGDYAETEEEINYIDKTYDFNDFDEINLDGKFEIVIKKDSVYSIFSQEPENNKFKIYTNGTTLHLKSKKKHSKRIYLDISLPELKEIRSEGFLSAEIENFSQEKLKITNYGAYSIKSKKLNVKHLYVKGNGAGAYNLYNAKLKNVYLSLEGLNSCELTMDGGILSGETKGVGNLEYQGDVEYFDVDREGPFVVNHR